MTSHTTLAFDHVGLIVEVLDEEAARLATILPLTAWTERFDDSGLGVSVCFAREQSGLVFELIAPLGDASPVARAAKTRRDRMNQLAYRTDSLEAGLRHLVEQGGIPLSEPAPALAFGGAHVQFVFMPQGFVIELIEGMAFSHAFTRSTPPTL